MNRQHPLIIAHRGSMKKHAENSMAAFLQALRDGADGIELDVFLTADRKVVVIHDADTHRLTGVHLKVKKSLYRELKRLNLKGDEKIPLLNDVLGTFGTDFFKINIEIKSTGMTRNGIESEIAMLIRQHKLKDKILVSSFGPNHLARFKKIMPEVPVAMLFARSQVVQPWYLKRLKKLNPETINPEFALLKNPKSPLLLTGKPFWVWNANDEKAWRVSCKNPSVEALIVDEPEKLKQWFRD